MWFSDEWLGKKREKDLFSLGTLGEKGYMNNKEEKLNSKRLFSLYNINQDQYSIIEILETWIGNYIRWMGWAWHARGVKGEKF